MAELIWRAFSLQPHRSESFKLSRDPLFIDAIRHFLDHHNQNPKPFVWTKSADHILDSVPRFCKLTLDTRH